VGGQQSARRTNGRNPKQREAAVWWPARMDDLLPNASLFTQGSRVRNPSARADSRRCASKII
jgi:hypothetical protein